MESLTRKILLEKAPKIWKYNNVYDVPDKLWYDIFGNLDPTLQNEDIAEYMAMNILCPLYQTTDYCVSTTLYDDSNSQYVIVTIDSKYGFKFSLEVLNDLTLYAAKYDLLTEVVKLSYGQQFIIYDIKHEGFEYPNSFN